MLGTLKKFIYPLIYMTIGFFIGGCISVYINKNEYFARALEEVNFNVLFSIVTLVIGLIIPITINFFSVKKQEQMKLFSHMIKKKFDEIDFFEEKSKLLSYTVMSDKHIGNLDFKYQPTKEDLTSETIRVAYLFYNGREVYNKFKVEYIELLLGLGPLNKDIKYYQSYINHYFFNLEHLLEDVDEENLWQVGVAIKNDLIDMHSEFCELLANYKMDMFKKMSFMYCNDNIDMDKIIAKLNKSNFNRYRHMLKQIKCKQHVSD